MSNQILINLVYLDFPSAPVRLHTAVGKISWQQHDWIGAGNLGSISSVSESLDLQPARVRLGLSGIPSELVRVALDEHYQGRSAKIWIALLDAHDAIVAPKLIFSGRIDVMQGALGEANGISVSLESRMADWQRPRIRRYTKEDQAFEYPADRGFDYVSDIAQKEILWGFTRQ